MPRSKKYNDDSKLEGLNGQGRTFTTVRESEKNEDALLLAKLRSHFSLLAYG